MGHRPVVISRCVDNLTSNSSAGHRVRVDQAIFTSIRSPMGEGYRIIAASPGLRPEEKVDITRRSPSHGALCGIGPGSIGFAVYRLKTGRHCVAYSCHAGSEHTARGGQRVYTQLVVLDQAAFRRFQSDPVCVHATLADHIHRVGPVLQPVAALEPLELPVAPSPDAVQPVWFMPQNRPRDAGWLWVLMSDLLAGRQVILLGAENAVSLLQWALLCVPRDVRESVDASVGLTFSPGRQMQLVLAEQDPRQLKRLTAGRKIEIYQGSEPISCDAGLFEPVVKLFRRWWNEDRFSDIIRLTSHIAADVPAATLNRIALLCEDIDRAKTADPEHLDQILGQYCRERVETPAELRLVEHMKAMIRANREQTASQA